MPNIPTTLQSLEGLSLTLTVSHSHPSNAHFHEIMATKLNRGQSVANNLWGGVEGGVYMGKMGSIVIFPCLAC